MKPLISVIIPVYNHAHSLERSLFSLYKQTYRPIEIVIVDDGSTDNFRGTMDKILKKDWTQNLSIKIFQQENRGAAAARNRGLSEVGGDYIIFWDADTIGMEQMFEKMLTALESNPTANYAYSQYKFGWKKMKSRPFDAASLKENNYIDTTTLIRRTAALPFDENIKRLQDWDLWLTMLEKKQTGIFVPEVLFRKIVCGRNGISNWLPSFFYRLPWKTRAVQEYEAARQVILNKHSRQGQGVASREQDRRHETEPVK